MVTAATHAPPVQVWDVLVRRSAEWWGEEYLGPTGEAMHLEARLGGRVYASATSPVGDEAPTGALHGTIRAFDPPERLEIGGVLVPGAYAGAITITVEKTNLGCEIRCEQMARGRVTASVEERIGLGWSTMLAAVADLAEH